MSRRLASIALVLVASSLGCAGMIVGSSAWFDNQKSDLQPKAATDLGCKDPIKFDAANGDNYREVVAHGCGKKVSYTYIKVGPVSSWKTGDVTPE